MPENLPTKLDRMKVPQRTIWNGEYCDIAEQRNRAIGIIETLDSPQEDSNKDKIEELVITRHANEALIDNFPKNRTWDSTTGVALAYAGLNTFYNAFSLQKNNDNRQNYYFEGACLVGAAFVIGAVSVIRERIHIEREALKTSKAIEEILQQKGYDNNGERLPLTIRVRPSCDNRMI